MSIAQLMSMLVSLDYLGDSSLNGKGMRGSLHRQGSSSRSRRSRSSSNTVMNAMLATITEEKDDKKTGELEGKGSSTGNELSISTKKIIV